MIQVLFSRGAIAERARALEYHVDAAAAPIQTLDLRRACQRDVAAIDTQCALDLFDLPGEAPVGRIVAGQVSDCAGIGELIDCDNLELPPPRAFVQGAEDTPPYPAVTIDRQAQHV